MLSPTLVRPGSSARSVRFAGVAKRFGPVTAVADVDLDIEPGQFVTLLGPSGCGKSTTLAMIAGLELPTEGRILIGDRDVTSMPPADRDIAMVFQSYALYPHLTIFENIAFPLRARRRRTSDAEVTRKVREAAAMLGLDRLLDRVPREIRAVNASGSRLDAPWCERQLSISSMSHSPTLTSSCGSRCVRS